MEIGAYIESELSKKGITKHAFHQMMLTTYDGEFMLAYNTFSSKIAGNTLNAVELLQIAALLNLDLNYLTKLLKESNRNLRDDFIINQGQLIQNEEIPSEVEDLFKRFSPNFTALEQLRKTDSPQFKYRITKKQKNIYELVGFFDGEEWDVDSELFVEELDLNKNEIRVIAEYIPYLAKFSKLDWYKEARELACEKRGDYFILFPKVVTCEEVEAFNLDDDLFPHCSISN